MAEAVQAGCCHGAATPRPPTPAGPGPYICPMCPGVESAVRRAVPSAAWRWSRRRRRRRPGPVQLSRCTRRSSSDEPGDCPICGMALEPMTVVRWSPDEPGAGRHDAALLDRRCPDACRLVSWRWAHMLPGARRGRAGAAVRPGCSCCWPRRWCSGRLALLPARLGSLVSRNLNMFTLIAMGTGAAYVYSLVATLGAGLFPAASARPARSAVYFEAAADHRRWCCSGQVLELRARETNRRRPARAARPGAQDRAARRPRGPRRGAGARAGPGRRSAARAAGRQGAGRRRGRGGHAARSTSPW